MLKSKSFIFFRILFFCLLSISYVCSADDQLTEIDGVSIIKNIEVISETDEQIVIEVSFYYAGEHGKNTKLLAGALSWGDRFIENAKTLSIPKGSGKRTLILNRSDVKTGFYETHRIHVGFYKPGKNRPFIEKSVQHSKVWNADLPTFLPTEYLHERLLADSIQILDNSRGLGSRELQSAKKNLEKIILEDPENVQAYLEMARVKIAEDRQTRGHNYSNGMKQAKKLIEIALEIDNNSANANILMGFVLGIQRRFDEAIKVLKKAKSIGTKNMWLYYNWGLAFEKNNDIDKAINIYQEAINLPLQEYIADASLKSSNRAIPAIYKKLINHLSDVEDWESIDKVYQNELEVLKESCQYSNYADFKLKYYGDYKKAIELAEKSLEKGCDQNAREVLSRSYLLKIAVSSDLKKDEKTKLFYKSQALTSNVNVLVMQLAKSQYTLPAITELQKRGIDINSTDVNKMTSLAYAVSSGNMEASEALLKLGAKPNQLVTKNGLTSLMLAVAYNNEDLLKLLMKNGADVNTRSSHGDTALSISKQLGNDRISKILGKFKDI